MTYFEQLHPWLVIGTLPSKECIVMAKFRRFHDAIAYLQLLERKVNDVEFVVSFNTSNEQKLKVERNHNL